MLLLSSECCCTKIHYFAPICAMYGSLKDTPCSVYFIRLKRFTHVVIDAEAFWREAKCRVVDSILKPIKDDY